jgi:hypothetical protein
MRLALTLAAALIAAAVPSLRADVLPLDTWEGFSWSDAGVLPSAASPTYTFTTTTDTQLQITDGFVIGDEFSVTISGTVNTTFDTSAINPSLDGVGGPGTTGPTSWADTDYSQATYDLGAGTYTVSIDIIKNAKGFTDGAAFIQDASVPEPTTLVPLSALLLVLLGCTLRKKLSAKPL